ncbi:PTS sugar transporter subunit IIB [Salmonella enterica subsp. enterica]|nr:PTS sugar transporter subunit IIB [Salmonella enterica subsp. enterica]
MCVSYNNHSGENIMKPAIVLCRIDSRLIHGQVVTKVGRTISGEPDSRCGDELDADPFMKIST